MAVEGVVMGQGRCRVARNLGLRPEVPVGWCLLFFGPDVLVGVVLIWV